MRLDRLLSFIALAACGGCFPTFQSPRVEPGWQTNVAATAIGNRSQDINSLAYLVALTPSYGFGHRFEVGIPLGYTTSPPDRNNADGTHRFMFAPYGKLALNGADSKDHLALILQTAALLPNSLAIRYGHDAGTWEPELGVSWIGTETGDDHVSSDRRMYRSNSLWMFSVGGEYLKVPARPALEIGLLQGNYERSFGNPPTRVSKVDLFIGLRTAMK